MELNREICTAWRNNGSLDDLLARLVIDTNSRAAGCWKLENNELNIVGFGSAADMTDQVSNGFRSATCRVPLDQTSFGIVAAVRSGKPTIALRDPQDTGLYGSASWIVKFEANSSLAIPIRQPNTNKIIGAIAVSTADIIEEGDPLWKRLTKLADELGVG